MVPGVPVYTLKERYTFMTPIAYVIYNDSPSVTYCRQQGIYTDSDMRDGERQSSMTLCIEKLLAQLTHQCGLQLCSGGIELVVELARKRNNDKVYRYYLVDHPNRLLFWLDEISTKWIFDGVLGVEKWSHISTSSCRGKYHRALYA